jgi:DNA (cytosine-5)-methyltransferase 1
MKITTEETKNLHAVDLFSGCGGMSLGFKNAGFHVKAAFDNWTPAIEVYKQNFDHQTHLIDLGSPEAIEVIAEYAPGLIFGGPPCQDFSSAGKNNALGGRASLTAAYANIITSIVPEYFVLENVPRILHTEVYKTVKKQFRGAGYGLTEVVVDASYCGVPQTRKRLFLIGARNRADDFLLKHIEKNLDERPMTMREYFGASLDIDYYFRIPTNYTKRAVYSVDEPCRTIRAVDRPIPSTYKKHPSDSVNVSDNVRTLSVLERSYIQTFPREFKFVGTKTNLNHMIGNAVPVKLAEFIAKALFEYFQEQLNKQAMVTTS